MEFTNDSPCFGAGVTIKVEPDICIMDEDVSIEDVTADERKREFPNNHMIGQTAKSADTEPVTVEEETGAKFHSDLPSETIEKEESDSCFMNEEIRFEEVNIKTEKFDPDDEPTEASSGILTAEEEPEVNINALYPETNIAELANGDEEPEENISAMYSETNSAGLSNAHDETEVDINALYPETNILEKKEQLESGNVCSTDKGGQRFEQVFIKEERIDPDDTPTQSDSSNARNRPAKKKAQNYICEHCQKTFAHKSTFTIHLRAHTGERPYICKECGAGFSKSSHLNVHARTHSGEKPYVCAECNASFSDISSYKSHLRTHSGEKPYACTECDARFGQLSNLKGHLRIHSGEKPFICALCSAQFSRQFNLKLHLRTHMNEKPFACEECGARFNDQGGLKRHLRRHSGEKPYACTECDTRFAHISSLKRHFRTHGEKSSVSAD